MRLSRTAGVAACALSVAIPALTTLSAQDRDLGLEVLGPNDGWAAFGEGTTGGTAAAPHQLTSRATQDDRYSVGEGPRAGQGRSDGLVSARSRPRS